MLNQAHSQFSISLCCYCYDLSTYFSLLGAVLGTENTRQVWSTYHGSCCLQEQGEEVLCR